MSVLKELLKMRLAQLRIMCDEFKPPIAWKSHWTKNKLSSEIIKRQALDNAASPEPTAEPQTKTATPKVDEFQNVGVTDTPAKEPDGRGGVRPGAGRPDGVTDELARRKRCLNLKQADPNLTALIQGGFAMLYGEACNDHPELIPSNDEAEMVSLPATKVVEYYFPNMQENIYFAFGELALGCFMLRKLQREKAAKFLPKPKPHLVENDKDEAS